ncbi:MAG TPA: hypothetical protein VEL76_25190 [Gemmataceae bacterium]|nr:hypothetical protein [Gemmataceae bacterium]
MNQDAIKEHQGAQKAALRERIKRFYKHFQRADWEQCYEYLDPQLRQGKKVLSAPYAQSLSEFAAVYGTIKIWHIDINLYLDTAKNKRDPRPFAYVYIFWQDQRHAFHVFRERWVREAGDWYTRVAGLVAHAKDRQST